MDCYNVHKDTSKNWGKDSVTLLRPYNVMDTIPDLKKQYMETASRLFDKKSELLELIRTAANGNNASYHLRLTAVNHMYNDVCFAIRELSRLERK